MVCGECVRSNENTEEKRGAAEHGMNVYGGRVLQRKKGD